jgi:hypothetical protein
MITVAKTVLGVAVLCLSLAPAAVMAGPSYMLVCTGPLPSTSTTVPVGSVTTITASFRGSGVAVTKTPPQGTCGWKDRGFRPGEPGELKFVGSKQAGTALFNEIGSSQTFGVMVQNAGDVLLITGHP